jgi:energy-coupling factor transporter ATP-binding protein EcfA2
MSKLPLPRDLGKGTPYKLQPDNVNYFDTSHHVGFFPVGVFFTNNYKCFPCIVHVNRTYTEELIKFLREKGKLFYDSATIRNTLPRATSTDPYSDDFELNEVDEDYKGSFLYKDTIITFNRATSRKHRKEKEQPLLFNISVYYKPGTNNNIKDFDKFLYEEKMNSVIHTIFRDDHGAIIFEPFETIVPEKFSIKKYYKNDFAPIHENILENLKKEESGLYLFHGEPGTGKTTYIKYLSTLLQRDMIYVPVAFIDSIIDPSFLPSLLKKRHSILVIEDAEKALLKREPGDSSSSLVSAILNITDGIMGNVFNISVIATYNSDRQDIDKALLRKGRLKGEYKFDKLSIEQCQKIIDENNIDYNVTEPMTLAEIFNTGVPDVVVSPELKEEKRMGFCK